MNFFDRFPEFVTEGTTGVRGKRLHHRYHAIIENQRDVFPNARVLDLARHDGRWSLAALDADADYVLGIEARPHLAEKSRKILAKYGFDAKRFQVVVDDCVEAIDDLEPGRFNIVLCLGFFYHTMHHYRLLAQIRRLNPGLLILDTVLSADAQPSIVMRSEDAERNGSAIRTVAHKRGALVGTPTIRGLGMMLDHLGFTGEFVDWKHLDLSDWIGVKDYREGRRFTVLVRAA